MLLIPSRPLVAVRAIAVPALGLALVGAAVATAPAASASGRTAAGHATAGTAVAWGPERASARTPQARSSRGVTTYLHSAAADDGVDGVVTYARSADGGATWTSRRMSSAGGYSSRGQVATAGSRVHVAWSVQKLDPVRDRVLSSAVYVRTSTAYGDPGSWLTRRKLPLLHTVSHVAASGSTVVVTGNAGRRAYVVVSRDRGRTWSATRLVGVRPVDQVSSAVVSGRTVAVVSVSGTVTAHISRDRGRSWSRSTVARTGFIASAAALGDRLVVMGRGIGTAVWVRTWRAGTWGPRRAVPTRPSDFWSTPLVALRGRSQVGILWTWRSTQVVDDGWTLDLQVLWRQSGDDGRTWAAYEQVSTEPGFNVAEHVMWRSTGQVYAIWERRTKAGYVGTHLRVRS